MMADYKTEDFIVLYPGKYTEKEFPAVKKYWEECERINNRGEIDIQALIAGTLPEDTPGVGPVVPVTETMVKYNHSKYEQENPLFNDKAYAQAAGFKDIPAYFTFGAHDDTFTCPYPPEVRDTLLVSQLSHSVEHLADVYAGDTLYLVHDYRTITDLTPVEGDVHRTLALYEEGSVYNQRGEKVNKVRFTTVESVRIFKEGKKPEVMGFPEIWEAPEWTKRPEHYYTDDDYEWMKKIWREETIRGSKPRYWEDVQIGDKPTPVLEGPIIESVLPTAPYGMGIGGTRTMKKEILDEAVFKTMHKQEKDGIYVLNDKKAYTPPIPEGAQVVMLFDDGRRTDEDEAEGAVNTADIHSVGDSRAAIINFYGRDVAIHHINNWMGDAGRIANISWSIMCRETHEAYGKPVPLSPNFKYYLRQAPSMKDKLMDSHGLTKDVAFVQSEVVDKYVKNGKYIAKLIWWIEEITGAIWVEGSAEVELPHRS